MKKLFYFIYKIFFSLGRLLPAKGNLVCLVSPHNAFLNDSLGEMKKEIERRGGYTLRFVLGSDIKGKTSLMRVLSFFTSGAVNLARAKYIYLNDNFMPMASLNFRKGTVITQLWHGEGALKKICLDLDLPEKTVKLEKKIFSKYTYIITSSKSVVPVWAKAFGKDESAVLPLGSPRTDAFFRVTNSISDREAFDCLYPGCRGKKLVLYAPTFRDDPGLDREIPSHFDAYTFNLAFGEEYALLTRLHPQVHSSSFGEGVTDVTDYPDIAGLLRLVDVLITDYSSVFMDYVLLDKPCIFYAYDLEAYSALRPFYGDYECTVPGPVVRSFDELLTVMRTVGVDEEKYARFKEYHLGSCDGKSAARVADATLK